MIMRRSEKALLVCIGWVVVCIAVVVLVTPIVIAMRDPTTHIIPIENAIPVLVLTISVCLPIAYMAVELITPLFMATLEVLDDGV